MLIGIAAGLAIATTVAGRAASAPYQDQGPVLTEFNGAPYEAVLTGANGAKAKFGLKQISPHQMVAMRGRGLIVYGTRKNESRNESAAMEEAGIWLASSESSPNWPPPDIRLVKDTEVTDLELAQTDVVLIGGAESNAVTARLLSKLPIRPAGSEVEIAGCGTLGSVTLGRFLVPNPLNRSYFTVVRFGDLSAARDDIRWSVAYRWTAAFTYFWHMTDYSFITQDGTIRGGYFAKPARTEWVFDPKLMVTVPNVFRNPYEGWSVRRSPHFVFHSAPQSAAEEKIKTMGGEWDRAWEAVYTEISTTLGIAYDRSIHVFFFDYSKDAERYAAVGYSPMNLADQKTAGLTDAKFGVILLIGEENARPTVTARHEVAHILAEKIAPPTVTFNAEGLACAMEGDRPSQTSGKTLQDWECEYLQSKQTFPPLCAMLRSQGFSAYPVHESYPLAASFTRFLINCYGLKKYKDYYKAATEGNPEAALVQVYSKTPRELERQWTDAIKNACDKRMRALEHEREAQEDYRSGRFNSALQAARKAVEADPTVTLAYFVLGACYNRIKRFDADAALAVLETYNAKLRQSGQPEQPWPYIEMGHANDLKGDREKALFWYNKAALLPDDRGSKAEAIKGLEEPFRNNSH